MPKDAYRAAAERWAPVELCFALTLVTSSASAQSAKPNVILFLTDDQGWTGTSVAMDLSVPGSASDFYETPALEELASQGMRFSHAYSPAAMCAPTRASILTGRSPANLHLTYNTTPPTPLPAGVATLPEVIKEADPEYVTGHFGKWHLANGGPGSAGFDVHDNGEVGPSAHEPLTNPKDTFGITARLETFIREQHAAGSPFFAFVAHHAPHLYVEALPATIAKYDAKPPGTAHFNVEYAAMIEDLDTGLGQLLDVLDELGIAGETYVIYVSDNGGVTGRIFNTNAPLRFAKTQLWEGGIRVPMVVRGPGIGSNIVSDVPVIGWDLLPTILDWIGHPGALPPNVEGASLRSILEDPTGQGQALRPQAHLVWHHPNWRVPPEGNTCPQSAIQITEPDGVYKLIRHYQTRMSYTPYLYNVTSDIGEIVNLASEDPERVTQYEQLLDAYLVDVGAQVTPDPRPSDCGWGAPDCLVAFVPLWLSHVRRRRRRKTPEATR